MRRNSVLSGCGRKLSAWMLPLLPCNQGVPKRGRLAVVLRIPWFFPPLLAIALALPAAAGALPSYDEVRAGWVSTEGVLLDRHGEVIHELRVDMHGRRLDWVKLEEVSPAFVQTVIRAEDKRFYKHGGVDWLALGDAALDNLFSPRTRGRQHAVDAGGGDAAGEPQGPARASHGRAEMGPDPGRARSGEEVEQAPDPRGLPEPLDLSRRAAGGGRGSPRAVRQAPQRAR